MQSPMSLGVKMSYMRRVYGVNVTRLTLGDLPICHRATAIVRSQDGLTEVSRGHSTSSNRRKG
jgi:hypothetical protein